MSLLGVCPDHIKNSLEAPACHSNKMMLHEPAMANGNGWAAAFLDGQWQNGQQQAAHLGVFAAGPKMGKSATM